MDVPGESRGGGASLVQILERLPVLSRYAKTRGWSYVLGWLHRFTGIGLILLLMVHLYALCPWQSPDIDHTRMKGIVSPFVLFLFWVSSLAVGFHALNGGRLILYELFGRRSDADMIRWVFALCAAYAATVGLMIVMNHQRVSAFFFWLMAFFAGAVAAYIVASRIWKKRHSILWKLQRISGAFLFITAPAYLLFLFLNPVEAVEVQGAVARLQNLFTRGVALTMGAGALYHAGYGLFSIVADYAPSRTVRVGLTTLIAAVITVLAALAYRLIFFV